jgi:hypothetical protein
MMQLQQRNAHVEAELSELRERYNTKTRSLEVSRNTVSLTKRWLPQAHGGAPR